jgi:hypothetical protein
MIFSGLPEYTVYSVYCVDISQNDNILAAIIDTILFAAGPEAIVASINILLCMKKVARRCPCGFLVGKRRVSRRTEEGGQVMRRRRLRSLLDEEPEDVEAGGNYHRHAISSRHSSSRRHSSRRAV